MNDKEALDMLTSTGLMAILSEIEMAIDDWETDTQYYADLYYQWDINDVLRLLWWVVDNPSHLDDYCTYDISDVRSMIKSIDALIPNRPDDSHRTLFLKNEDYGCEHNNLKWTPNHSA